MKSITKRIGAIALLMAIAQVSNAQFSEIQYMRKNDKEGRNVFETSKVDPVGFSGQKTRVGAGFTQSFQALDHSNTAVGIVKPIHLEPNFTLATANLMFDTQLADGLRLNMELYLSSRHHSETWVKGGYLQMDKIPFWHSDFLDNIMEFTTVKAGHFEINYGDAHFRRTDNGKSIHNPFVENLIMDGFSTEIAAEVEVKKDGWLGVLGLSNGLLKGDIVQAYNADSSKKRTKNPSLYGKVGFDKMVTNGWRLRLTQSFYHNGGSTSNTLFAGDRTGSNYWGVLSLDKELSKSNFATGRYQPGFNYQVTTFMTNVFSKYAGFEVFGTFEKAKGRGYKASGAQLPKRNVTQFAVDALYYFNVFSEEDLYLGVRYNTLKGELSNNVGDGKIDRFAVAAGYFLTKNVLVKGEWVKQKYAGFPTNNVYNGAQFNGFVLQAVIGF